MIFRSLALAVAMCGSPTVAFSGSPGGCATPIPVDQLHIATNPTGNGTLADGGFTFTINDEEISVDGPNSFAAGDLAISLSGAAYKGFLVRVASDDVDDTLGFITTTEPDAAPVSFCEPLGVGSLGHVGNAERTSTTGTIAWPLVTEVINLDVTVVVSNSPPDGSVFYVSNFEIETTDGSGEPAVSEAPSVSPSSAPSGESDETEAPSAAPSGGSVSPVAEGSMSPVAEGSMSPVAEGSMSPVAEVSASPVAEVSASPVAEESASPVAEESASPVAEESAEPSAPQTEQPSSSPSLSPSEAPETTTPAPTQMPVSTGSVAMKEVVASVLAMGFTIAMLAW